MFVHKKTWLVVLLALTMLCMSVAFTALADAPGQVTGLSASMSTASSVKLSWNAVSGADGYQLQYAKTSGGTYYGIKTMVGGGTSTSTGMAPAVGSTYYYRVRAYVENGDGTRSYGEYSGEASASFSIGKVSGLSVSLASSTSASLSWNKVSGASGYQVWRSTTKDGTYSGVKTVSGTSTTNGVSLAGGGSMYYKVRAYVQSGSDRIYGSFSDAVGVTNLPQKVTGLTGKMASTTSISLSWDKQSSVSGYQVWRSLSKDSGYTGVKSITTNSTTNGFALNYNQTVYYKVRAYTGSGSARIYGEYSEPVAITNSTPIPAVTQVTGLTAQLSGVSADLTWNKQANATGYQLWRCNTVNGTYTGVKSITTNTNKTSTSCVLGAGESMFYKVRAFIADGAGNRTYGPLSDAAYVTNNAVTPLVAKVTGLTGRISSLTTTTLTWTKLDDVSGYQIWRRRASEANFVGVKSLTTNVNTTDNAAVPTVGEALYYKVRAFKVDAVGNRVYGEFSDVATVTYAVQQVTGLTAKMSAEGGQVEMTWDKLGNVTGYQLWRSDSYSSGYVGLKSIMSNTPKDATAQIPAPGKTAFYKVRGFIQDGDGNRTYGAYSTPVAVTALGVPSSFKVTQVTDNTFACSWNAVTNATRYYIYVSTSASGTYTLAADVAGTSANVVVSGAKPLTTYYFKIQGYWMDGATAMKGAFCTPVSVTTISSLSVTGVGHYNSVDLTWNNVDNYDSFVVYRKLGSGSYTLLSGSVTYDGSWHFTDTTPIPNNTYTYSIVGFVDVNGVRTYSTVGANTAVVSTWLPKATMTEAYATAGSGTSSTMRFKWTDKLDVTSYEIQYSLLPRTDYATLTTMTDDAPGTVMSYLTTAFTGSTLTPGNTYYFRVRTCVQQGGVSYYGGWSDEVSGYIPNIAIRDASETGTSLTTLLYFQNAGSLPVTIGASATYFPLGTNYVSYDVTAVSGAPTVNASSSGTYIFNYTDGTAKPRNSASCMTFTFTVNGRTYQATATTATGTAWTLK